MATAKTKKGGPHYNAERAGLILADVAVMGVGPTAAKWKISRRTIERYQLKAHGDPKLSQSVAAKLADLTGECTRVRRKFVVDGIAKLTELLSLATREQIRDVTDAIVRISEIEVMSMALGDGSDVAGVQPHAAGGAHQKDAPKGGSEGASPVH